MVRKAKPQDKKCLIVEKIKPRRLVFEETLKSNNTGNCQVFLSNNENGILTRVSIASDLLWREVKETGINLTNEEPKLSVDEYDFVIAYLFKSCLDKALFGKVSKILKENS